MSREERQPIYTHNNSTDHIRNVGLNEHLRQKRLGRRQSVIHNLRHHDRAPGGTTEDETSLGADCFDICNPHSTLYRFIGLILMCLIGFGAYFCYDNPGALQNIFREELGLSATQFTLIYSIYSWPNVILCFVGGFLIDRVFGIRMGTIIYLVILLVGQVVFAYGALLNQFWLMILGRFIFGIGAESLTVAQNNYAVLWFNGRELNMVFGLQLSVARLGSTVNFWVMQPIYSYFSQYYKQHVGVGITLMLAAGTCCISLFCALLLGWMDKRSERVTKRENPFNVKVVQLSDVLNFKRDVFTTTLICVAYYMSVTPFIALGQAFFAKKFDMSSHDANSVNSVIYLISAIASPVFGFVIDRTGRNISWVFTATVTTLLGHCLLTFTAFNPYIGTTVIGLAYSMLAASLWPIISLLVPEYQLGTAYGFCQSILNLGLAVVSIATGVIVDNGDGDYFWIEIFFISWLIVALIAIACMWQNDLEQKTHLNMTPQQRESYQTEIALTTAAAKSPKRHNHLHKVKAEHLPLLEE